MNYDEKRNKIDMISFFTSYRRVWKQKTKQNRTELWAG